MITPHELVRLWLPLSALPGFDSRRLPTQWYDELVGLDKYIDLADSSTADRVARWMAVRTGLEVGCTAPPWEQTWGRIWRLSSRSERVYRIFRQESKNSYEVSVPAFVDINPDDTRKLPDGSRYIDRLAMTLAAKQVGGSEG